MTGQEWLEHEDQQVFLQDAKTEILSLEEALIIAYQAGQATQIEPGALRFLANEALSRQNDALMDRIKRLLKIENSIGSRPVTMIPVNSPDPDNWSEHEAVLRKAYRIPLTLSMNQRNNLKAAVESLEAWVKNPDHARDAVRDFLAAHPKSKIAFFPDDFGAWIRNVRQSGE